MWRRLVGSRPSRARGLKLDRCGAGDSDRQVAPITGAWVETSISRQLMRMRLTVAPITGAWVETLPLRTKALDHACRAHHGRVG